MANSNISALEEIIRLIEEKKLVPMKKWSERKGYEENKNGGYFLKMKNKIRSILELVSGNDLTAMLKSMNNW